MKRCFSVFVPVLLVLSLTGCRTCPIDQTTFQAQAVAVKSAYEASASAEKNWAKYTDAQKLALIKANTKAWAGLNKVYNKK